MSYIDNNLLAGETIRLRGHVHWIIFFPAVFLLSISIALYFYLDQMVVSAVIILIATLSFVRAFIYYFTTELAVTSQRIVVKFGFIRRTTYEYELGRVTGLNVVQSVLGRVLNYGDVYVNSMGGVMTPVPVISDPVNFRHQVLGELEARA